jgi:hypothetical protein
VQDALAIRAGTQARGKAIRCALKDAASNAQTSVCMLVGGLEPIPNGSFARLELSASGEKPAAPVRVRVHHAIGVYRDLRRISLKPVELVLPPSK